MKHFYLIANPLKQHTRTMRGEIAAYLERRGAVCSWSEEAENDPHGKPLAGLLPEDTECVITLGGDGTLIRAARSLIPRTVPLLGINMGTMGYLTQVAQGEKIAPMLDALLEGNYRLERRMMLEGKVLPAEGGTADESRGGIALNEIVLARSGGMQPIRFRLYVNGQYLNEYTADGMIAATPTGSTAYNLSAGGPIVTPGAELIVLTPICSHALNSSSIVLGGQDTVELRVPEGQRQTLAFDGDTSVTLGDRDVLRIRRAACETAFIRLKDVSFLDALRDKLARV